jgi:hypothetical protein
VGAHVPRPLISPAGVRVPSSRRRSSVRFPGVRGPHDRSTGSCLQPCSPWTATADGCTVTLHPPADGWGQGPLRIELHRGITARNGEPFVAPMIVPLRAR